MSEAASFGVIRIAAAVVTDATGRVLLVRKRGTDAFMLPGGKPEPGEDGRQAVTRELSEEIGGAVVSLGRSLGSFRAPAANEPGHVVDAELFAATLVGEPEAGAEIEELHWYKRVDDDALPLAPLARLHVLPLIEKGMSL